jgi:hypothetical protein
MDSDDVITYDEADNDSGDNESWIAEQARLVLLEDGS